MSAEVPTILCVDDEPNIRRALRRALIDEDWNVVFASGGEEGLREIQASKPHLAPAAKRGPRSRRPRHVRVACGRVAHLFRPGPPAYRYGRRGAGRSCCNGLPVFASCY